jgi:hypothetical protein
MVDGLILCSCYGLQCEGRMIGGLGADLWRIRAETYSTCGATVPAGTVHAQGCGGG